MQTSTNSPLLVIVGETASGKSTLALQLAQRMNGEIICADSWTVRRGVNIGTAKPAAKEQKIVRHHLLDIVEPCEDFTAAVFKRLANQAINDISSSGKLAIMAGGTGLYIDSVLYDYGFLEAGDRSERHKLNEMSLDELLAAIESKEIDTEGVDKRNKRRLIRLLETGGDRPTRQELRPNSLIIGLSTNRDSLMENIIKRVDGMLKAGLENEVRLLSQKYGWQCEALKGVGYAQWQDYFLGTQSLPETRQKIIRATLDLAKRQRTWFKRNKSIQWFSTPVNYVQIVESITTHLDT